MKDYKVRVTGISRVSAVNIESILREELKLGWTMKQIIANEATDEYIIIFKKEI